MDGCPGGRLRAATPGAAYGIDGPRFREARLGVEYKFAENGRLRAALMVEAPTLGTVRVMKGDGSPLAQSDASDGAASIAFDGTNGDPYKIALDLAATAGASGGKVVIEER